MTRRTVLCSILASFGVLCAEPDRACSQRFTTSPVSSGGGMVLVFTPDGKTILSANSRSEVSLRDGVTGSELRQLKAAHGTVSGLAIAPDGKTLAIAGSDGAVQLWDLPEGKVRTNLLGHQSGAETVAFAADSNTLASAGPDGIRLWDAVGGKQLKSIETGNSRVTGLSFAPDGKTLATAGTCVSRQAGLPLIDSDAVRLWDMASGKQTMELPIKGHAVAFSADGRYLIAGGYGVYLARSGEQANLVINQMAFRPMNRVALWDVASHKEVAAVENLANAFALSHDGRFFAVGRGSENHFNSHKGGGIRLGVNDNSRTLTLRESLTGQAIHMFPMPEGAAVLALSPDGTRLAVGRPNGTVVVLIVAPKAEKRPLETADLERLWSHLGATEAGPAFAAVWSMAGAPDQTVPFLKSHLAPVKWDRTKMKKWIDDLDSDDFDTRDSAARELRRLGGDAEAEMRRRLKSEVSAEVNRAIKELLEAVDSRSLPLDELRAVRAVHALERAATPAARAVLTSLSGGEPDARLTRESKQALARLAGR